MSPPMPHRAAYKPVPVGYNKISQLPARKSSTGGHICIQEVIMECKKRNWLYWLSWIRVRVRMHFP